MPVVERMVTDFLPTTAGLHFANRWPSAPAITLRARLPGPVPVGLELTIGDAANGLCGGMALTVLDLWAQGQAPPPDRQPPAPGSALFRRIVRRQVDSLVGGRTVWSFYAASAAGSRGRARIAVREAWPALRTAIDASRPALVGLVHVASADPRRLVANHQVVAYAYEHDLEGRRVTVRIYDPNHPDDNDIRLALRLAGSRGPMEIDYIPGEAPVIGIVPLGGAPQPVC